MEDRKMAADAARMGTDFGEGARVGDLGRRLVEIEWVGRAAYGPFSMA